MNPRSISNAIGNAKVFRSISYTLVFLMMACVLMTIGSLIQNALPDWHSGIIAGVTLFILIDRLYTYQQLRSLTPLSSEWVIAHAAQWIVILLFIRFLLSYANGLDSFLADLSLFARGYLVNLFTAEFVITLLLAFLVWVLTTQFLELLDEIGLDMKWALSEESVLIQSDAVPAHQRLVNLIFSIGIVLVILTALTLINLRATFSSPTGIPNVEWNGFSGAEAGALLYFVFGLALLSLSRLMSLQTHWNRLRIPVSSDNLVRQWGVYSLFFLLILAVIVSLLPAGDSLGFFSVVGTLFGFLIRVLLFLSQLFVALVFLLFSLPFLFFGQAPPFINRFVPPPLPTLPVQPTVPTDISAIWALIRSILLWGSLLVILVYSFIRFVKQHDSLLAALRKSRVTNWLILAWQWLRRNVDRTRDGLSRAIAEGWQSIVARLEGKRILSRPGWISLRTLDPRGQIFFFYLAMIRRGGEQGLTRKPSQTPSEYAVQLEQALPSASEDIDSITEAFVEARYSRQEVDSRKADFVKATWGRIRRALQSKSKSEQSANK
jgi:Domain of unknown function (DUF4129)